MMGYGWGFGWIGWIGMIAFWALTIGLVVWAVTRIWPGEQRRADGSRSAREELDLRLARGEVDPETYEKIKAQLSAGRR